MTKETLFAVLNDLDDAHITQAEAVPPKKRGWRVWAGLAACLAIAVGALFWRGHGAALPLSAASTGVTVRYGSPSSTISLSTDLTWLTEEELFTEFDTAIFLGTVTRIDNIVLDFNGSEDYRALAQIQVKKAYRGPYQAGDTVTVLLPCPITEGV